jgi:hypothetical protein
VHGHDADHLDVGDAEDLISLVGLPPHLPKARNEQVAAMPQQPMGVEPQPPPILLGVDHQHPARPDQQVDAPMVVNPRRLRRPG